MITQLVKNDFFKNVFTLFTGTAIAQALPVVITPILTRIYGPKEFGVFAVYTAILTILSVFSTGRYELAIMIPESDRDAVNIAGLAAVINVTVSCLLFVILLIAGTRAAKLFGIEELGVWLYFIPVSLIILSFSAIIYYWLNRRKMYKVMSVNKVIQQAGIGAANISFGFASGGLGLILGTIIGQVLALWLIVKRLWAMEKTILKEISKVEMKLQAKRFANFPKYFMGAHALNVSSRNLVNVLFSSFFSAVTVGYFTLTQRVLSLPISLIGGAVTDVFRQNAAEEINKYGNCKALFLKSFKTLVYLSIIPFTLLYIFSPWLFSFVFGSEWSAAGEYARLMMPMLFFQFITSPLSGLSVILEKNRYEIIWQTALFISTTGSLVIGYAIFHSIKASILLFSIAYSTMYIIDGIMMYRFASAGNKGISKQQVS